MFEKTLLDLIKGIRSHRVDSAAYISNAVTEIKTELKSSVRFFTFDTLRTLFLTLVLGQSY